MAAPAAASNLIAESNSSSSVTLTWTDNSDNETGFKVQRALFGGVFSTIDTTAANVVTYTDETVTAGTRYEYKIVATNADGDATASNTVNVVVQVCAEDVAQPNTITLDRFEGEGQQSDKLNASMQKIEELLARRDMGIQDCLICPSNGAVIIDCSKGCQHFTIAVTEDINSISIIGCDNAPLSILEFVVPTGTTRKICGFPTGFGFEGGECSRSYGAGSYYMRFLGSRSGPRLDTADSLAMTVSCFSDDGTENTTCTYDCSDHTHAHFRVTGGLPPYSISGVDGVGEDIPAGAFKRIGGLLGDRFSLRLYNSAQASEAYRRYRFAISCNGIVGCTDPCLSATHTWHVLRQIVNCDGSVGACSQFSSGACATDVASNFDTCGDPATPICIDTVGCTGTDIAPLAGCDDPSGACTKACRTNPAIKPFPAGTSVATLCSCSGSPYVCDKRDSTLRSNGCAPCEILDGATITITDSLGITVAKVLDVTL